MSFDSKEGGIPILQQQLPQVRYQHLSSCLDVLATMHLNLNKLAGLTILSGALTCKVPDFAINAEHPPGYFCIRASCAYWVLACQLLSAGW
jgi:hypothetical protein